MSVWYDRDARPAFFRDKHHGVAGIMASGCHSERRECRMDSEPEKRLRSFFAEERNVRLAFLMGSFAKGTARSDSDVDVAVEPTRSFLRRR